MSLLNWIDEITRLLTWEAILIAGILFSYLGARALAQGERGRKAWGMVAGGIAISLVMGAVSFFVSVTLDGLLPQDEAARYQILPEDWGAQMPPAERESKSIGYARLAFTGGRKIVKYVDQAGTWRDYCPTAKDTATITEYAEITGGARAVASKAWRSAFSWWVSGALALLAGAHFGRRATGGS